MNNDQIVTSVNGSKTELKANMYENHIMNLARDQSEKVIRKYHLYLGALINSPKFKADTYCYECKKLVDLDIHDPNHPLGQAVSIIVNLNLLDEALKFFLNSNKAEFKTIED